MRVGRGGDIAREPLFCARVGGVSWWETFFDSAYLRIWGEVLKDRDPAAEAAEVTELVGLEPPARLLDVPCGFGRVSEHLARLGFEVVGVEAAPEMVTEARRRCCGLPVTLIEGDMRELPVDGVFDAALCLFSSIGYTTDAADDLRFFSRVRQHLRQDGVFVIESQHRDRRAAAPAGRSWLDVNGEPVLTEPFMDWVTGIGGETLCWIEEGIWVERRFELYLYTATELRDILREAGFRHIDFYGGYDRRPLAPDTRLVAVAR